MAHQIPLGTEAFVSHDASHDDSTNEVGADLSYKTLLLSNVAFIGLPGSGDRQWALVDAGVGGMAGVLRKAAEERFSPNARPAAIILTHGHFDHVGALEDLAMKWDVPVYAHPHEIPYLDGSASYPPPDPTVGGGLMSWLSRFYPRGPVDVRRWLRPLPADGTIPELPGWSWIHTPGHTPGHVSLWREWDRALIAGDAFITTNQESAYAVARQAPEMHGPPMYFTINWEVASLSVALLADLEPEIVVTGHGPAMEGERMREALHRLAQDFETVAVPEEGRYVSHPVDGKAAYVKKG